MKIKRLKIKYSIESELKVLGDLLEQAVQKENYELAAIIKSGMDDIIISVTSGEFTVGLPSRTE